MPFLLVKHGADTIGTGYETTANNLIYSCIVLALYPDIQARAQEDVDAGYMQLQDPDSDDLSYSFQHHKFRYLVAFMVRTPYIEGETCIARAKSLEIQTAYMVWC